MVVCFYDPGRVSAEALRPSGVSSETMTEPTSRDERSPNDQDPWDRITGKNSY